MGELLFSHFFLNQKSWFNFARNVKYLNYSMRKLIFLSFILSYFSTNAQESNSVSNSTAVSYFAQAMYNYTTDEALMVLESNLKTNPYVKLIRLDKNSKTLFLITKDVNEFDLSILEAWLTTEHESVSCVHIGIYGLDELKNYPNEACK
jgi:hypothetical protein